MKLAADENVERALVLALRSRLPELELVTVQEAGLGGAPDPDVLAWAAAEDRVLLTHDSKTMPRYAYQRIQAAAQLPGVIIVRDWLPIARVIEDIALLAQVSAPSELRDRVIYLPL